MYPCPATEVAKPRALARKALIVFIILVRVRICEEEREECLIMRIENSIKAAISTSYISIDFSIFTTKCTSHF